MLDENGDRNCAAKCPDTHPLLIGEFTSGEITYEKWCVEASNSQTENAGYWFYEYTENDSPAHYTLKNSCDGYAYVNQEHSGVMSSGSKYECVSICPPEAPFVDDFVKKSVSSVK